MAERADLDQFEQRLANLWKVARPTTIVLGDAELLALVAELRVAHDRLEAAHRAAYLVRAARAEVRRLLDERAFVGAVAQVLRRVHTDLDEAVALTYDPPPSTPHRAGTP